MKKWALWVIAGLMLLGRPAVASDYVDHALTFTRLNQELASPGVAEHVQGQMVLWQGTVLAQTPVDDKHVELTLRMGAQGEVQVRYAARCPTLQVDRTGYRVAAKGRLHLEQDKLTRVEGVSLILLEPAGRDGYRTFSQHLPGTEASVASFIGWRFWFHHPEYSPEQVVKWGHQVVDAAAQQHLDPLLLAALMQIESAYDVQAVSHSGAVGLGQLMDFTAAGMGLDAHDPGQNIQGSARYLGGLFTRFATWPDPMRFCLAAYNAGPEAVERCRAVPHVPETTNYVTFVKLVWKELHTETSHLGLVVPDSASLPAVPAPGGLESAVTRVR